MSGKEIMCHQESLFVSFRQKSVDMLWFRVLGERSKCQLFSRAAVLLSQQEIHLDSNLSKHEQQQKEFGKQE